MRNRTMLLIGALLLVLPGFTQAQQAQQPPASQTPQATIPETATAAPFTPKLAQIDFGVRASDFEGDQARYDRFRDLRDGAYLDRFRLNKETETWLFHGEANDVGYRDQRFTAEYQNIGKVRVDFDWNQIPLFISGDTRSLYSDNGSGILSIDRGLRQAVQDATVVSIGAAATWGPSMWCTR